MNYRGGGDEGGVERRSRSPGRSASQQHQENLASDLIFTYTLMSDVVMELLEEKGVVTREEVMQKIVEVKRDLLEAGFQEGPAETAPAGAPPRERRQAAGGEPTWAPEDAYREQAPLDLSLVADLPRIMHLPEGDNVNYEKDAGETFVIPDPRSLNLFANPELQKRCTAKSMTVCVTGLHFGGLSACREDPLLPQQLVLTVPGLAHWPDYHQMLAPPEYCVGLEPEEEERWVSFLDMIGMLLYDLEFRSFLKMENYAQAFRTLLVALCLFHGVGFLLTEDKPAYRKAFRIERRSHLKLVRPATFEMLLQ
ncbi:MAG: hypothetical protein HYY96_02575 [Candidatus Tectomicrobia bacterium]|nr:hypothetical protein [Candidatus Tectomicrobia bacterium]